MLGVLFSFRKSAPKIMIAQNGPCDFALFAMTVEYIIVYTSMRDGKHWISQCALVYEPVIVSSMRTNSLHASSKLEALLFRLRSRTTRLLVCQTKILWNQYHRRRNTPGYMLEQNTCAKRNSTDISTERRAITTLAGTKLMIGINFRKAWSIWQCSFGATMLQMSKPSHALTYERTWICSDSKGHKLRRKRPRLFFQTCFCGGGTCMSPSMG